MQIAILLTELEVHEDLIGLTELETKSFLESVRAIGPGIAEKIQTLRSDDPHLLARIEDLAESPVQPYQLQMPVLENDW
jgi:hypothetical protein